MEINICLIKVPSILIRLFFEFFIGYPMSILQNIHHWQQTMHPIEFHENLFQFCHSPVLQQDDRLCHIYVETWRATSLLN